MAYDDVYFRIGYEAGRDMARRGEDRPVRESGRHDPESHGREAGWLDASPAPADRPAGRGLLRARLVDGGAPDMVSIGLLAGIAILGLAAIRGLLGS